MKKQMLFLASALCALLVGCANEPTSTPPLVEGVVLPPATEAFRPGSTVTIAGKGFTAADQIVLRGAAKAEGDLIAAVSEATADRLVFVVPAAAPAGEQSVVLSRNGTEQLLGSIRFKAPKLIQRIKENWSNGGSCIETYRYDDQHRGIVYESRAYKENGEADGALTFKGTYVEGAIQVVDSTILGEVNGTCTLDSEGRIAVVDLPYQKVTLTYNSNGQISEQKLNDGQSSATIWKYTWTNGSMTKSECEKYNATNTFTYSNTPNKTNFDGIDLIGWPWLSRRLGLNTGVKSKYLVSEVSQSEALSQSALRSERYSFAYDLDEEGYPVKITKTTTANSWDPSRIGSQTIVEITYTE